MPDQRYGTIVTARPEEQFAPNRPSLSRFALYIAARCFVQSRGPLLPHAGYPGLSLVSQLVTERAIPPIESTAPAHCVVNEDVG